MFHWNLLQPLVQNDIGSFKTPAANAEKSECTCVYILFLNSPNMDLMTLVIRDPIGSEVEAGLWVSLTGPFFSHWTGLDRLPQKTPQQLFFFLIFLLSSLFLVGEEVQTAYKQL